jgi:hypothetical protein
MGTYDTIGGTPRHDPSFDHEGSCDICGHDPSDCICPECPVCGAQGDKECYIRHGLPRRAGLPPFCPFCRDDVTHVLPGNRFECLACGREWTP